MVIRNNESYDNTGGGMLVEDSVNVVVEGNTAFNCGVLGGEGDCFDIKDGNTDVTIRSNHFYGNADGPNVNGITASSPITAERNVIHDTPGGSQWERSKA